MLYNQFRRLSRILIVVTFLIGLYVLRNFHKNLWENILSSDSSKSSSNNIFENKKFVEKIFEIADRQPTYRFYAYEGYELDVARRRAQAKLIDNLKVYDRCQQNPRTLIVDVGASFGDFGLYAAACGCQVHMFEINPDKIVLIKKSIELNSFQSRVTLSTDAVSDLPTGTNLLFSRSKENQIKKTQINDVASDAYSAKTVRLSEIEFKTDIYLLHVNVNGDEIHVIRSGEMLFHNNTIHHVLFQYTPSGTDRINQNDLLSYMRDILGGKRFYALHPRQSVLYGPLYNEDIDQFYSQHHGIELERDVYVLFRDDDVNIDSKPYEFASSFD